MFYYYCKMYDRRGKVAYLISNTKSIVLVMYTRVNKAGRKRGEREMWRQCERKNSKECKKEREKKTGWNARERQGETELSLSFLRGRFETNDNNQGQLKRGSKRKRIQTRRNEGWKEGEKIMLERGWDRKTGEKKIKKENKKQQTD